MSRNKRLGVVGAAIVVVVIAFVVANSPRAPAART